MAPPPWLRLFYILFFLFFFSPAFFSKLGSEALAQSDVHVPETEARTETQDETRLLLRGAPDHSPVCMEQLQPLPLRLTLTFLEPNHRSNATDHHRKRRLPGGKPAGHTCTYWHLQQQGSESGQGCTSSSSFQSQETLVQCGGANPKLEL